MSFQLGPLCGRYRDRLLWFRLWPHGPGFKLKDVRRHRLLFSERVAGRGYRLGWLHFSWARRGPA